jgi:hypothetical protein
VNHNKNARKSHLIQDPFFENTTDITHAVHSIMLQGTHQCQSSLCKMAETFQKLMFDSALACLYVNHEFSLDHGFHMSKIFLTHFCGQLSATVYILETCYTHQFCKLCHVTQQCPVKPVSEVWDHIQLVHEQALWDLMSSTAYDIVIGGLLNDISLMERE